MFTDAAGAEIREMVVWTHL